MAKKKNQNKLLKAGIIGALVTGSVYYSVKKAIVGNKIKKAIFLTSASAFILYNCHGDKLEKLGTKIYEGTNSIINNPVREENKFLSGKLYEAGIMIDSISKFNELKIEYEKNKTDFSRTQPSIEKFENKPSANSKKAIVHSNNSNPEVNWYVVKKGETLSGISEKLTGKGNLYSLIAEHNRISNPSEIPVGFPLKIPEEIAVNKVFLNKDEYPNKLGTLKRGESLEDFVAVTYGKNVDTKKIASEIINYNTKLGNVFPEKGYRDVKEAIIYLR